MIASNFVKKNGFQLAMLMITCKEYGDGYVVAFTLKELKEGGGAIIHVSQNCEVAKYDFFQ
jgi:hypothetical protein